MANRSDFYNTSDKCPRLPRSLKKMLALQSRGNAHDDGAIRRIFIEAHQAHVKFKLKRGKDIPDDVGDVDLTLISPTKNKETGALV